MNRFYIIAVHGSLAMSLLENIIQFFGGREYGGLLWLIIALQWTIIGQNNTKR